MSMKVLSNKFILFLLFLFMFFYLITGRVLEFFIVLCGVIIFLYVSGKNIINKIYSSYKEAREIGRSRWVILHGWIRWKGKILKWAVKRFVYKIHPFTHKHVWDIDMKCLICGISRFELDHAINQMNDRVDEYIARGDNEYEEALTQATVRTRQNILNRVGADAYGDPDPDPDSEAGDYIDTYRRLRDAIQQDTYILGPTSKKQDKQKNAYFTIGEYLKVQLDGDITNIYVKHKTGWEKFRQCKYLLLKLEGSKTYEEIESIDDAADKLTDKNDLERDLEMFNKEYTIPPRTEFWGHCSNLQAWYEHDYDLRLIHTNLGFPLIRELIKVGDRTAKTMFKEEIMYRIEGTGFKAFKMFEEDISKYFTKEEKEMVKEKLYPSKEEFFKVVEGLDKDTYFKLIEKVQTRHGKWVWEGLPDMPPLKEGGIMESLREWQRQPHYNDIDLSRRHVETTLADEPHTVTGEWGESNSVNVRRVNIGSRGRAIHNIYTIQGGSHQDNNMTSYGDFLDLFTRVLLEYERRVAFEIERVVIYSDPETRRTATILIDRNHHITEYERVLSFAARHHREFTVVWKEVVNRSGDYLNDEHTLSFMIRNRNGTLYYFETPPLTIIEP